MTPREIAKLVISSWGEAKEFTADQLYKIEWAIIVGVETAWQNFEDGIFYRAASHYPAANKIKAIVELSKTYPDLYAQLCQALADRHKLKTALDLNDAITSVPAWKDAPPEVLDKCVYRFAYEGPKIEGTQLPVWEWEKPQINKEGLRKYIAWLEEELVRPTATETYRRHTAIRLQSAREVLAKIETEDGTVVHKPLPPVCTCKSLLGHRDKDCPVHRGE